MKNQHSVPHPFHSSGFAQSVYRPYSGIKDIWVQILVLKLCGCGQLVSLKLGFPFDGLRGLNKTTQVRSIAQSLARWRGCVADDFLHSLFYQESKEPEEPTTLETAAAPA